jgi:chromosome segregation ATPase
MPPSELVKEREVLKFFMEDINQLLDDYKPGSLENKPDVIKQISEIQENREKMIKDHVKQQNDYNNLINKFSNTNANNQPFQNKINELSLVIQELTMENNQLKDKVSYFEGKIKQLITEQIQIKNGIINNKN